MVGSHSTADHLFICYILLMKYIEIFGIIKTHSFENLGTFMQNFFEILGIATAGVHSNPDGRIYVNKRPQIQ